MGGIGVENEPVGDTLDPRPPGGGQGVPAEPFVRKAEKIALHLHHKDLRIAHLLLAIAVTGKAASRLTAHGLDVETVRRCCWRTLEGQKPEPDIPQDVVPSGEINELYGHAATFSNGKELEVDHILRAINDVKLVGQFGSLIRNPETRPEDMAAKVSAIKEQLDKEFPEIERHLGQIEAQQGITDTKVSVLQHNVGSGGREGNLHRALDVLRSYTTTLKYIVIVSALALAFVVAIIRIIGGP